MKQAVIDTNVLVSAAINPSGPPGQIIAAIRRGELLPIISRAVFDEYVQVLTRPHFGFRREVVNDILGTIESIAPLLEPPPIDVTPLPDASDAPFIALARYANCPVITGNAKHFPASAGVVVLTPAGWVASSIGQPL